MFKHQYAYGELNEDEKQKIIEIEAESYRKKQHLKK